MPRLKRKLPLRARNGAQTADRFQSQDADFMGHSRTRRAGFVNARRMFQRSKLYAAHEWALVIGLKTRFERKFNFVLKTRLKSIDAPPPGGLGG